jgi:hypothetical protein
LFPEHAVSAQPPFGSNERRGGEAASADAAGFLRAENAGVLEDVDVLQERGQRHRVLGGQRRHRGVARG